MPTDKKKEFTKLEALLGAATDGIITINSAGVIDTFNAAAEKMFCYHKGEVRGKNINMLMPEPWASEHDTYMQRYSQTGEKRVIGMGREVAGLRKDGSVFPLHLCVGEYNVDGETHFVGILHDLTIRKRTEDALFRSQKMEAIGQLTGGIAHDFNNLLTIITGNLELLDAKITEANQRELLQEAAEAAELGAELTSRLLTVARRSMLEPAPLDLNTIVASLSQLLKRTLGQDIELLTHLSDDLWTAIADPGQLESAILNLAVNARDAMPNGGRLVIETGNQMFDNGYAMQEVGLNAGEYVCISVSENGTGMAKETLLKVFDPFFTTKPTGKGTGLGLSMVYGFAKQSGGHITIYSEEGLGTTVNLYLPKHSNDAKVVEDNPDLRETGGSNDPGYIGGKEAILVVEDDPKVRALTSKRLEMLGYQVEAVEDGKKAIERLQQSNDIQMVLTDLVMPGGISGYDLASYVIANHKSIKLLLTSGYAEDLVNGEKLIAQNLPLLRKPYSQAKLAQSVRKCLDA